MTTYILCGGNDRQYSDFGTRLYQAVHERVPGDIDLLDVYFAGDETKERERYDEWTPWFEEYFPGINRTLATREDFASQVERANVMYVHGGRTRNLLQALPDFAYVTQLLKGKVYIGSSAGANYIAEHFVSHEGATSGSSILPINIIVHYEADDLDERRSEQAADELAAAFPDARTVRIREGEFEVIEDV